MAIAVREVENPDPALWNCRVESVPEGTIHQSTHLANFHMVTGGGYRPQYLVAEDERGEVVGQLALLVGFFAAQEVVARPYLKGLMPLCARAFGVYTWMQGPLVFAKERFAEVHQALLGEVDRRAKAGAYQVRRATLPPYEDPALSLSGGEALLKLGFVAQPEATFHVDLRRSPELMWQQLKSSARKNLRKMLDEGRLVLSTIESPEDARCYWEMLVETQRRSRRFISYRSQAAFADKFWSAPHQQGVMRGVLVRTQAGEAVAGLCFRCYNGWIHELGVAYTEFGTQNKLYGQDLIKWHLMGWGHAQGLRYYDLMGVEPKSTDAKKRAIFQFKEKWGGVLVEFQSYTKGYSPWREAVVRLGTNLTRSLRQRSARPPRLAASREERQVPLPPP